MTDPTFNPHYRVARCGQKSSHGPHIVERGPDQPRNCPGTGSRARLAAEPSRFPSQCTRELDVEPTGAPDEDVCLGDVDPSTGRCGTCGTDYARLAAGTEVVHLIRDGSATTSCCHRAPFELAARDGHRLTVEPDAVTCGIVAAGTEQG